ncbi:rho GTPase-activating protein 7 [Clupea harengus]|uniref:Rho GTPase-activating protein 7 n=1 Tax=Clupea harengus TaxID=7950 RepID=A0A6P8FI38_CLUHA|nr:rho GTPase-activating protein 7 [Clupea harengus]
MLITKIEAKQACDWLKAAGFPQYAQLFKDCRFPIDLDWAKNDHAFLDKDAIDSLCRRLITLNKCVEMNQEMGRLKRRSEDSEDEEPCAISAKWTFNHKNGSWIRQDDMKFLALPDSPCLGTLRGRETSLCDDSGDRQETCSTRSSSSLDSDCADGCGPGGFKMAEEAEPSRSSSSHCSSSCTKPTSLDTSFSAPPSPSPSPADDPPSCSSEDPPSVSQKPPRKKGPSLLRRMERLRVRGPARSTRVRSRSLGQTKLLISGPVLQEGAAQERLKQLNCLDIAELQGKVPSPGASCSSASSSSSSSSSSSFSSSSSASESGSTVSTPSPVARVRGNKRAQPWTQSQDQSQNRNQSQSQSETTSKSELDLNNQRNQQDQLRLHEETLFRIPEGYKPGTFPTALSHGLAPLLPIDNTSVNWRTGSFHGYHGRRCRGGESSPCSPLAAIDHRASIYDNVPDAPPCATAGVGGGALEVRGSSIEDDVFQALDCVMERINSLQQLVSSWAEKLSEDGDSDFSNRSSSPSLSDILLEVKEPEEDTERNGGDTEESRTIPVHQQQLHWWSEEQALVSLGPGSGVESQLAAQMNRLQRLSLLRLTALMDRFSPSCKQGWIWTGPNVPRTQKKPQHKNRKVFGVPLRQSAQTFNTPLPPCILRAMQYLKTQCFNQVGLFRKPGVKSRIQSLRDMVEADPEGVSFEDQSAFDVADMVKHYFRDLPEPVFSEKLNESFLHIYQYFPKDQQFAAVRAAIFLLPDENREALQSLLLFLREVAACVEENQMTPTNIAVCLAPTLFHLSTPRGESRATRHGGTRKHSLVKPDQRDLSESLAATQGLAHMLAEVTHLFQLPGYCLPEEPLQVEASLGTGREEQELCTGLQQSAQQLLREAKEKARGWVSCPSPHQHVDLAYKKVEDGQALRLWRGSVEVEAPQQEALQWVLRRREAWAGEALLEAGVLETLGEDAEVYSYTLQGAGSRPPLQHVLLRTWQSDPSAGPLYVAAASLDHHGAPQKGLRAQVYTCLFLVEPLGMKRSRLTHFCRTDTRGRSSEWHSKVCGHQLASGLQRLRESFKAKARDGRL